jgi:hypothetical protein
MTEIKLPDLEKVEGLVDEINTTTLKEARLTVEIKLAEADTVRTLLSDPVYFQNGKPLAMNAIQATCVYPGIQNSLVDKRKELAEISALLEAKKNILKFYYVIIDLYRTESANARRV